MEVKKYVKQYWWVALLMIPVGIFLSAIRIRRVKTIHYTDAKGNIFSVKGTVKRNASNTGFIINGHLIKTSDPDFQVGRKITTEFLDKDIKK